jgi:hypothetical protein
MKKRSLHKLHIDGTIWKWYVKGQRRNIIVFAPTGKRYEINLYDFLRFKGINGSDFEIENSFDTLSIAQQGRAITPAVVKDYIIRNIKS